MHIIIGCAVDEEEFAFEVRGHFLRGVFIISRLVFLWGAHVALGIDVVIIAPVGNRGNRDSRFKYVIAFQDTSAAHKAAIAPAPNAYTVFIHIRQLTEVLCRRYLVIAFILPKLQVGFFTECFSAPTCTGSIYAKYDVAFLSQHLVPKEIANREPVGHF